MTRAEPLLADDDWKPRRFAMRFRSRLTHHVRAGEEMNPLKENYQRITDESRSFDIRFWQSQGDRVIFEAVSDMLDDYFLIRGKDADEFRLQRTVESFRKA